MLAHKEKFDVIIIGSGASGSAAAWNLSKSNLKILCLEQGPQITEKEYPVNFFDWEIKKRKKFHFNPNIRKSVSDYMINDQNSPISIANFNAVGGATVIYSAHFPRFHPSDFKTRTLDKIGEDWPFGYDDLKYYYDTNDNMMGVSGISGDPAYPDIENLLPPVSLGQIGNKLASSFEKLGWHWWPSYSAIITKNYKNRDVNSIRYDISGAKYGTKADVNKTYLSEALRNGVKLLFNCRVVKILRDNYYDKVKSVIYEDESGNLNEQETSLVVLACNGIGTPRLLLNSYDKKNPEGLCNSSGLVGKNLMLHPLGYVEGHFPDFLDSSIGPNGCCIASHEFYETDISRGFKRGYSMQILRGLGPLETCESGQKFNKIKFGKSFHEDFFNLYGHVASIAIICEDFPEEKNYIELDFNLPDSSGMPGVKIHYSLSENSKRMLAHGINRAKEVFKTAGAKNSIAFGPVKNSGWHLMGTTKMGKKKKESVVNENGQSHDLKNLVIVDSSVFITSSGVNPTSTMQALALKFTDKIKKHPKAYN